MDAITWAVLVIGGGLWLASAGLAIGLARASARREQIEGRGGPRVIGRDVYLDPMDPDRRP